MTIIIGSSNDVGGGEAQTWRVWSNGRGIWAWEKPLRDKTDTYQTAGAVCVNNRRVVRPEGEE